MSAGALDAVARYAADVKRFDLAIDALERAARLPTAKPGAYDERIAKLRAADIDARLRKK